MEDAQNNEPAWLSKRFVRAMHAETLRRVGGTTGLRKEGRLESALDRPKSACVRGAAAL